MEPSQPLAVKVTDLPADPPKRKPKPPPPVPAAKPIIAVDKPLSERTKAMYAPASDPKAGKERPEIPGLKSIAERNAELQQAIKSQSTEAQATVQVGSVRNRLEEFKAVASQSGAVGNKHAAEVGMSMSERMAIFKNSAKASSGLKVGQEAGEEGKNEHLRTGKVAELAAKMANSERKIAPKTGPVEVTSGIAERIQKLQEAIKSGTSKPKDFPQEGLSSLQDRKNQLFTKTQPSKSLEDVPFESVKGRISIFSGQKQPEEYEDSSDEPDEEVEMQAEPVQIEKKPSTQQSLMAKYASKSTIKAKNTVKQGETELKKDKGSERIEEVPIKLEEKGEREMEGEGEWEEIGPVEEKVAKPIEKEEEITNATGLIPVDMADNSLKTSEIPDKKDIEAENPKEEVAHALPEVVIDPDTDLKGAEIPDKKVQEAENPMEELAPSIPVLDLDLKVAENAAKEVKEGENHVEELVHDLPDIAASLNSDLKAAEIAEKEAKEAEKPIEELIPALPETVAIPSNEILKDEGEGVGIEVKQRAEEAAEMPTLLVEPLAPEEHKQDPIPPHENMNPREPIPSSAYPGPDVAVPLEPFPGLEGLPDAAPPLAPFNVEDQADPEPAEAEAAPPE